MVCSIRVGVVALYRLDERPKRVAVADGEVICRASYGHGRGRGSVPGVMVVVTIVLTRRAVVKHSGSICSCVIAVVGSHRSARQ